MISILILGVFFLFFAIQFRQGKSSRLVGGNTFDNRPKEEVGKATKIVSNLLIFAGLLLIYIGLDLIISYFF
ncbi:hypothetical protein BG261_00240 [Floricoccus tropicus]|uniref:Uncharacterized protein n=1 Tax=Floricoccus tropicus TaxID=1859473 RepID=A0A1E8GQ14_9LACT|nr:hypothetical protein BG261_00240 [Floricoccus tropicus]